MVSHENIVGQAPFIDRLFANASFRTDGRLKGTPFMAEVVIAISDDVSQLHIPSEEISAGQLRYKVAVAVNERHELLHAEIISPELYDQMHEEKQIEGENWADTKRRIFLESWSKQNDQVMIEKSAVSVKSSVLETV